MNDDILLPLTAAGAIAISAWALIQWASAAFKGDKRKLAQRLSMENRSDAADFSNAVRALRITDDGAGIINKIPPLAHIKKALFQAWPTLSLGKFLGITFGAAAVAFVVSWALIGTALIASAIAAVAGYIPYMILSSKRNRRQRALSDQLPEALDFLSRVLRSGHSFSTGLQMLADEGLIDDASDPLVADDAEVELHRPFELGVHGLRVAVALAREGEEVVADDRLPHHHPNLQRRSSLAQYSLGHRLHLVQARFVKPRS